MRKVLIAVTLLAGCVETPPLEGTPESRMLQRACLGGNLRACEANERFAIEREQNAAMMQGMPVASQSYQYPMYSFE